jgi:hypothetical protein
MEWIVFVSSVSPVLDLLYLPSACSPSFFVWVPSPSAWEYIPSALQVYVEKEPFLIEVPPKLILWSPKANPSLKLIES